MKRRVWYRVLSICITWLSMWCISFCPVNASEPDYIITPIITNDAAENEELYFDLTIKPSRKQVIKVEVRNNTEQAVTVYTKVYTAVHEDDSDQTVKKDFSELLEGESEIVIPAKKMYLFQFTVNMPAEGLGSPLEGAVAFLLAPQGQETSSEASQAAEASGDSSAEIEFLQLPVDDENQRELIRAEVESLLQEAELEASYSYVIPLILGAEDNARGPVLSLKDISITDDNNEIKAKIQNTASIEAEQVTITATARRKGKKKIFFEIIEEKTEIPAHSIYELSIPSKGQKAEMGVYTLQVAVTTASTRWQWEKDFTIAKEKPDVITQNETASEEKTVKSTGYYFLIFPVVILVVGVIVLCIILYRKKRIEEQAITQVILDIKKNIL